MSTRRPNPAPARSRKENVKGFYRIGYHLARAAVRSLAHVRWDGVERLPKQGPFILAPNHMTELDPIAMGYFLAYNGYEARFLAKDSLFKVPLVGPFMRWWGMIPVVRDTSDAGDALVHAKEAIALGDAVTMYFEGTLTRDPALWPMKGKTGLARLAMDTRVPIVPVIHWGVQDAMDRYTWPRLRLHKPTLYLKVLPELDYSDISGDSSNREGVRELTGRLEQVLMEASSDLRGSVAPTQPWNFKEKGWPDKKQLKRFSNWRNSLASKNRQPDILPADPNLNRVS